MKKILLLPPILISTILICQAQGSIAKFNHQRAIELNNKAVLLSQKYSHVKDSVLKSIRMLDEAIKLDPSYETSYMNKISTLCFLGKTDKMLPVFEEVIKVDSRNSNIYLLYGNLLEKLGFKTEARMKYQIGNNLDNILIKANPNVIRYKIDEAFFKLFLNGKQEGLKAYQEIAKDSNDPYVIEVKSTFYDFNRKSYIKNFCPSPNQMR